MLDPNAKQILTLDYHSLDNATLLSYTNLALGHGQQDATMQTKLGSIWTAFATSATNYDEVYNPSQKDLMSDDLKTQDDTRDKSVSAWHEATLAQQKSPNQTKALIARQLVQLYKDYKIDQSAEYMKETENIAQMIQQIEADATITAALPTMGLDDYFNDLKTQNETFAAMMAQRTAGTVGQEKGVVQAARDDVEEKYRTLVRMVNVVSSYEGNGELDTFIDTINAEIRHFRDILARKGKGKGKSSGGGNNGGDSGSGESGNSGESGSGDNGGSGSGSGDNGGGELPPDDGGGFGGGSDDQGGSGSGSSGSGDSGSGSDDNGGSDLPPEGGGGFGG